MYHIMMDILVVVYHLLAHIYACIYIYIWRPKKVKRSNFASWRMHDKISKR